MQLVLTPEAKADISHAVAWYRDRSVRAADNFLIVLTITFSRIEAHPTAHVVVDVESGARRALLRGFPYRVLYLIHADRVVVFAVMHHRRDTPAWHDRLQ